MKQCQRAPLVRRAAPSRLLGHLPDERLERLVETRGERIATEDVHPAPVDHHVHTSRCGRERARRLGVAGKHAFSIDTQRDHLRSRPIGTPCGDRRFGTDRDQQPELRGGVA